ncbi:MAG TPA: flagellin, partial [Chloroflexota bacterium]|nr:flagellin [Chloroflexota bacterium]
EIVGLISEIDQVAQQTHYNSTKLLNGSAGGATVAAGGPDITDVQAQAGVAENGTQTITASISASQSTVTGNVQSTGVMQGGGSVTIVGPTGVSGTFTSYSGESVATFLQQVNDSAVGVTASIDPVTNKYVLTSNDYGIVGTSASNGIKNPTGPKAVQVIGSATDPDFASAGLGGADLGLVGGTSNSPNNAAVTIGGAMVGLTGVNSDQFNGTSATAGLSFRVINPGAIGTGDQITVTQNGALQLQTGPDAGDQAPFSIDAQNALALGVNALDLTSVSGAQQAITDTQTALAQIATVQTNLGALQSTLIDNETAAGAFQVDALQAHSNLVDANIAQETIRFARDQILMESGAAVIAQANQVPGNLFALLLPSIKG